MKKANPEAARAILKWAIRNTLGMLILSAAAFVSAGTLAWPGGWWFTGILASNLIITAAWLIPKNRQVLDERSEPKSGTKTWDRVMAPLVALSPIGIAVVSGLHYRLGWTPVLPDAVALGGIPLALLASAFVIWAMAVNTFFSGTVRIQEEREHRVIDTGPYSLVRHPGYLGASVVYVCFAVVLASFWALIPAAIGIVAIVVRTGLEDATLRSELNGYSAYSKNVKYRLVPGIW